MANQSSRIEVKGLTETMFEIFNGGQNFEKMVKVFYVIT